MKENLLVVVADGARARLFVNSETGESLNEVQSLVAFGSRAHPKDLTADRAGRGRSHVGSGRHEYAQPSTERDKSRTRFARAIAERVEELTRERRDPDLVIAAAPAVLGCIRKELSDGTRCHVAREINKDWTTLAADQIRHRLFI